MRLTHLNFISALLIFTSINASAQVYLDTTNNMSAKRVQFADIQQFAIGSYGEAHYNQTIDPDQIQPGKIDLHRVIMYLGYRFNDRAQFFTEIELEHTSELAIEQAFVNYRFDDRLNFKSGLLLVPMGYVNEFHEPTLFNGVERPNVDKYIIPSTWREIGAGFQGLFKKATMKYQLYVMNGFNAYPGGAKLSGSDGIRGARQGGDESSLRMPSYTGKLSYFGFNSLLIEGSFYSGKTESSLYKSVDRSDATALATADSSSVGINMLGVNMTYTLNKFQFRGEAIYTELSNTHAYNTFTGSDVGSAILGWYGEIAYTQNLKKNGYLEFIPFVRYEYYDTHHAVHQAEVKNTAFAREEITAGFGLKPAPGLIFKADYQLVRSLNKQRYTNICNVGFGYWF